MDKCPYCDTTLSPMPVRAKKCPSCKERIYPRINPLTGEMSLFKENDAGFIDAIKNWGLSSNEVNRLNVNLIRTGTPGPTFKDILSLYKCEYTRQGLLEHKRYVQEVEFYTSQDDSVCPSCRALNGKKFKIDDALQIMPTVVKNCTNKYGCRCVWLPVIK